MNTVISLLNKAIAAAGMVVCLLAMYATYHDVAEKLGRYALLPKDQELGAWVNGLCRESKVCKDGAIISARQSLSGSGVVITLKLTVPHETLKGVRDADSYLRNKLVSVNRDPKRSYMLANAVIEYIQI